MTGAGGGGIMGRCSAERFAAGGSDRRLSMEMRLLEADETCTVVKLAGKLNPEGVREIEKAFTEAVAGRLKPAIVDFGEVVFLSSIGVRLLLLNVKALMRANARMAAVNAQPAVAKVLETAGMGPIVPCAPTVEAARALLGLGGRADG